LTLLDLFIIQPKMQDDIVHKFNLMQL